MQHFKIGLLRAWAWAEFQSPVIGWFLGGLVALVGLV